MGARALQLAVTLDYRGLYGPATPADPATPGHEAAQTATWRIPRTEPPSAPLSPPFVARSVGIDNATGRWWRVAGRWIPPWTVGAVVPVDPPSAQLTVDALTPTGQVSEAVGDELVVVASSMATPYSSGIYAPPTAAVHFLSVSEQGDASEFGPGTIGLIPNVGADERAVVVGLQVAGQANDSLMQTGIRVRVELLLIAFGGPVEPVMWRGMLSPESPMADAQFPIGSMRGLVGGGWSLTMLADEGGGRISIAATALYYVEAVA